MDITTSFNWVENTMTITGGFSNINLGDYHDQSDEEDSYHESDEEDTSIVNIQPWTWTPTHYGGTQEKNVRLHWSFLPRVANLPAAPRKMKIEKSPSAYKLFQKLYQGGFTFKVETGVSGVTSQFCLSVFEKKPEDDSRFPDHHCPAMIMDLTFVDLDMKRTQIMFQDVDGSYDFFHHALRVAEKEQLATRILHKILRHQGSKIPDKLFKFIKNYLDFTYGDWNDTKGALDVAICYADIIVSTQREPKHEIAFAFLKVGEGLEHVEAFEMAADVYERAAHLSDNDRRMQWYLWKFSGLALKRAEQYGMSEQAYYEALRHKVLMDGKKLLLRDEDCAGLIFNVLYLYAAVMRLPRNFTRPLNAMEKREGVFTTLLQMAGYALDPGQEATYLMGNVECRIPSIKPQFLNPEGAHLALLVAILKPSFDGFCQHLLNCLRSDTILAFPNMDNPYTIHPKNRDEKRRHAARISQQELRKTSYSTMSVVCGYPVCSTFVAATDKFFTQCKCKTVTYCSTDCQKAHWDQEHKEQCVTRKKCSNSRCDAVEEVLCGFWRCPKCHSAYYCSKICQAAHWKTGGHKEECKKLCSKTKKSRDSIKSDVTSS